MRRPVKGSVVPHRIVIVSPFFAPARQSGGVAVVVSALGRALVRKGMAVRVVTTDLDGPERMATETGVWRDLDGMQVYRCHASTLPRRRMNGIGTVLREAMAASDIAVSASTLWLQCGGAVDACARRMGLPHVVYLHGLLDGAAMRIKPIRKQLFMDLIGRRMLNRAGTIIALNEQEAADIRSRGVTSPITIIPNGVATDELVQAADRRHLGEKWPALGGHPYFLFLGRIHQKKGIEPLIDAFCSAKLEPAWRLVIAGYGESGYLHKLIARAQARGAVDRILFTGAVEGELRNSLYHHARAFVLTSHGEGQPMAALEAMACGTPVLLSPGCNLPEAEEHEAGWIVPVDAAAIASALERISNDDAECARRGTNARALIHSRFSWDRVAERTIELFDSLPARTSLRR